MFSVGAGSVAIYLEGTREPLKVCELESARTPPALEKDESGGNDGLEVPGGYSRLK